VVAVLLCRGGGTGCSSRSNPCRRPQRGEDDSLYATNGSDDAVKTESKRPKEEKKRLEVLKRERAVAVKVQEALQARAQQDSVHAP
jgi:hypothetical protein